MNDFLQISADDDDDVVVLQFLVFPFFSSHLYETRIYAVIMIIVRMAAVVEVVQISRISILMV